MRQPTHLSFSQIKLFKDCPKAWYVQKVLGEEQPPSDAANRGSQTDQLIAHRLGLTPMTTDPLIDRVEEAVDLYFANGGWNRADEAQRKIELSPSSWDVYRELYDVDYTLPLPIVGYIDLYRTADNGIQRELADIKTSERAEFRADWALQGTLYSLVERAVKFEVHLLTFTKQIKLVRYEYRPTEATFKWVMNQIGSAAAGMVEAMRSGCDKLPANPGFWCRWCSRQLNCEGAMVGNLTAVGGGS